MRVRAYARIKKANARDADAPALISRVGTSSGYFPAVFRMFSGPSADVIFFCLFFFPYYLAVGRVLCSFPLSLSPHSLSFPPVPLFRTHARSVARRLYLAHLNAAPLVVPSKRQLFLDFFTFSHSHSLSLPLALSSLSPLSLSHSTSDVKRYISSFTTAG